MKRVLFFLAIGASLCIGILSAFAFSLPWGPSESQVNGFIAPVSGSKDVDTPEGCRRISGVGVTKTYFVPTKTAAEWNAFKTNLPSGFSIGLCSINGVCGVMGNTCTTGVPSSYSSGSCGGSQTWACNGISGGTNASCSIANPGCTPIACSTTASFALPNMNPYGIGALTATYYSGDTTKFVLSFPTTPVSTCGVTSGSYIFPRNGDILHCSLGHGVGIITVSNIDECHIKIGRKFFDTQVIEICSTAACSYTYSWSSSSWGACSVSCGGGTQTRSVTCQRSDGVMVADSYCSGPKPSVSQSCNTGACASGITCDAKVWSTTSWNKVLYTNASSLCASLGVGWRIPTKNEIASCYATESIDSNGNSSLFKLVDPATYEGYRYWTSETGTFKACNGPCYDISNMGVTFGLIIRDLGTPYYGGQCMPGFSTSYVCSGFYGCSKTDPNNVGYCMDGYYNEVGFLPNYTSLRCIHD